METSLLVSILAFETYWAYYSMSSGQIYQKAVKEAAKHLLSQIGELASVDSNIVNEKTLHWTESTVIEDVLNSVRSWADGESDLPYETFLRSRVYLWQLLTYQKIYLTKRLGLKSSPPIIWEPLGEGMHSERYLRWAPHLPTESLYEYDRTLEIPKLSKSQTIVIFGDIRRSQDLMTYTVDRIFFEDMMIKFFDNIKNLFNQNLGIIDKFTGDGFLGYFNEYLCGRQGKDFVKCFLQFVKESMLFSNSLFADWQKHVRKLPVGGVMLAIGADVGEIYFGDRYGHLVCIGDAIVWAQRMCCEAPAGAVYANNILAHLLKERENIELLPIEGKTKAGETFLVSKIIIQDQQD